MPKVQPKPQIKKPFSKRPNGKPATGKFFEPDPKDANTVNSIREKLNQIREYKKILAEDGIPPDAEDKALESELIKQLIRIEKGLSPKSPSKKVKKKSVNTNDDKDSTNTQSKKNPRDFSDQKHRAGRANSPKNAFKR
jgi:hypothetical protein